jgi:hypothetical protein
MPGKHNQGAGTIASEISSRSAAAILNRHVSESRVLPLDPCPCASPKPRPNEKSCAPPARAAGQNYLTIGRALERLGVFDPRAELRRKPAGKSNPFAGVPVLIIRQLGCKRPTGTERKIAQQKVRMEGWRQRRLGSEPKTHLRKTKTVLTSTGLLMEGVGPHLSRSGRRASCLEPVNHLVPSLNLRKAPFY